MAEKSKSKYLVDQSNINDELKKIAELRTTPKNDNGDRLLNDKNEPVDVKLVSAKEGGSYRGRIIANDKGLLVTTAGKNEEYAIVHNKEQVDIQGSSLKKSNNDERLVNNNVQIHYKGDQAKMYPWNPEKSQEAAKSDPASKARTNEEAIRANPQSTDQQKIDAKENRKIEEMKGVKIKDGGKSVDVDLTKDQGMDR